VTNVPKGALTPNLKNVEVTVQNKLHYCKILRSKFKYENHPNAITPKVWCLELWFLCTALLLNLNEIYLPMKFQGHITLACVVYWDTSGQEHIYMPFQTGEGINTPLYKVLRLTTRQVTCRPWTGISMLSLARCAAWWTGETQTSADSMVRLPCRSCLDICKNTFSYLSFVPGHM